MKSERWLIYCVDIADNCFSAPMAMLAGTVQSLVGGYMVNSKAVHDALLNWGLTMACYVL